MTAHQTPIEADAETLSGAEIVVRALLDQGVDVLFGYPGGAVLPIYDALFAEPTLRQALNQLQLAFVEQSKGGSGAGPGGDTSGTH